MSTDTYDRPEFSVAIARDVHDIGVNHLLRHQRAAELQEDLCFGLWRESTGARRTTALVHELVLPRPGETLLQGNVSFAPAYLERATAEAAQSGSGLVLMHSHLGPGWQGMSPDDIAAERGRAPFVFATTDLPLVGMTLGTDGAWSARFWPRVQPREYECKWCVNVRVVGKKLDVTYHPRLRPIPRPREEQVRTISAWGQENQANLCRIHVGIVGLGSVGRLIAELLARMGIQRITLIDFDQLRRLNLDRQIGAYPEDAEAQRFKVEMAKLGFERAATAESACAEAIPMAVTELAGFEAALDCDVIFCCVDRPWGRRVLNHLAFAHLIPVVEGGIIVRTRKGVFRGAEWSCRTAGPDRRCLKCAGGYDPAQVDDERRGLLDDPSYIDSLPPEVRNQTSQNVLPFSMGLAAFEVLQFCALVTGMLDMPDLGDQRFHYNLREVLAEELFCDPDCEFPALTATGDSVYPREALTGPYPAAEAIRLMNRETKCHQTA